MNRSGLKNKLELLMGNVSSPQGSNKVETYDDDPSGDYEEPQILNPNLSTSNDYITANVYSPTPLNNPHMHQNNKTDQLPYYLDMEKAKTVLEPPKSRFIAKQPTSSHIINRPPMPLPVNGSYNLSISNKGLLNKPKLHSKPAIPMKPVKPHKSQLELSQGYDSNEESIYEIEPIIEEIKPAPNIKPKISPFKLTSVKENARVKTSIAPASQNSLRTSNKTPLSPEECSSNKKIESQIKEIQSLEKHVSNIKPKCNPIKEIPVKHFYRAQRPAAPLPPPNNLKTYIKTPPYQNYDSTDESIYEMEPQIEQIKPVEKSVIQIKPKMNPRSVGRDDCKAEKCTIQPPPKNLETSDQVSINYQNYDCNEELIYEMEPQIEDIKSKKKPVIQIKPEINPRTAGRNDFKAEKLKEQLPPKNVNTSDNVSLDNQKYDSNEESIYEMEPEIKTNEPVLSISPKTCRIKENPAKQYCKVQKIIGVQLAKPNSLNIHKKVPFPWKKGVSNKDSDKSEEKKPGKKLRDIKNDHRTQGSVTPTLQKKTQPDIKEPIWNVSNIAELPKPPPLTQQFSLIDLQDFSSNSSEEADVSKVDPTQSRFYRNTDRKGTKNLLQNRGDGAFLFRPSSAYKVVLTVVYNRQFHKLGIDCNDKDRFYCIGDESNTFATLDALVEYYKINPLSVKSNDGVKNLYLKDVL